MELVLTRFLSDSDTTLGQLTLNNEPICFTLEDEFREEKVAGETRIPAGVYRLVPRTYGRFFEAYNERWDHEFVIELEGVPGFTDILIHTGNNDNHTEGCILVGSTADTSTMTIGNSRGAYVDLFEKVKDQVAIKNCYIRIIDND